MSDTAVTPSTATFDQFGLAPDILKAVKESGYTTPTPIQEQAIPVVLAGRDVMGAAQTGTGKTASFSLPIIQRLLPQASTSASPARHPVRALILTPTRELADQVAANVQSYAKHTALRSAVVFGGVDMNPQSEQLRRGVEILIATPGRLLDHVQQKTANLGQVQICCRKSVRRCCFRPRFQAKSRSWPPRICAIRRLSKWRAATRPRPMSRRSSMKWPKATKPARWFS
jgi:superfamily II DNA/RNA helicase